MGATNHPTGMLEQLTGGRHFSPGNIEKSSVLTADATRRVVSRSESNYAANTYTQRTHSVAPSAYKAYSLLLRAGILFSARLAQLQSKLQIRLPKLLTKIDVHIVARTS